MSFLQIVSTGTTKLIKFVKNDEVVYTKLKALWRKEYRNEESKSEEKWKSKENWLIAQTNRRITKRKEQNITSDSDIKQHQHNRNTQHSLDELKSLSSEEYEHIEFERHFLREEVEIAEKDLTRSEGGRPNRFVAKGQEHKSEVVNEDPASSIHQKIISPSKISIFVRRKLYLGHRKTKAAERGRCMKRAL